MEIRNTCRRPWRSEYSLLAKSEEGHLSLSKVWKLNLSRKSSALLHVPILSGPLPQYVGPTRSGKIQKWYLFMFQESILLNSGLFKHLRTLITTRTTSPVWLWLLPECSKMALAEKFSIHGVTYRILNRIPKTAASSLAIVLTILSQKYPLIKGNPNSTRLNN